MADLGKLLENTKQEIRSVLIAAPRGIALDKFPKEFRGITGQQVPYREFAYTSIEEFLRSIPDVVRISWSSVSNDLLLYAVADESTKHIQELVSKQKVTKSKPSRYSRFNFVRPPRFQSSTLPFLPALVKVQIVELMKKFPEGIGITLFLNAYQQAFNEELNFNQYGFRSLEECLTTVPRMEIQKSTHETRIYRSDLKKANSSIPAKSSIEIKAVNSKKPSVENSVDISKKQNVSETNNSSKQIIKKVDDYSDNPPQVSKNTSNQSFPSRPDIELWDDSSETAIPEFQEATHCDDLDEFDSLDSSPPDLDRSCVSKKMKLNFIEILKQHPNGIWAADFPEAYETLTHCKLNLSEVGYYSLIELIDALPDIFTRTRPPECKSDWLLSLKGATNLGYRTLKPDFGPPYIDRVITNIRRILQANPEGLYLDDLIHIYCMNCDETLDLSQLGFGNIEAFLLNIKERIPLQIDYSSVKKRVLLADVNHNQTFKSFSNFINTIPEDVVKPGAAYEFQSLPPDLDTNKYYPMYIATVVNPSLFWIQLKGPTTSVALDKLMDDLQAFYCSSHGDHYLMEEEHIAVGTICVGIWSSGLECDYQWHRIHITGMLDLNYVNASFVDYGTSEKVKKCDLRYIRKEFLKLPAQAIKSRLAYVKPVGRGVWSPRVRSRMLDLCKDTPLMGQIVNLPQYSRYLSLWLCDTSSDDDTYINVVLINEGYAEKCYESSTDVYSNEVNSNYSPPLYTPRVPEPNIWSSNNSNQMELLKAISTILQAASPSAPSAVINQPLLESLLHMISPASRQTNSLLFQQLLAAGIDSELLRRVFNMAPAQFPSHNPQPCAHSSYAPPLSSQHMYYNSEHWENGNKKFTAPYNMRHFSNTPPISNTWQCPTNHAAVHTVSKINYNAAGTPPGFVPNVACNKKLNFTGGKDFNEQIQSCASGPAVKKQNEYASCYSDRLMENTTGEIFDDDDDVFDKYCEQLGSSAQIYIKRLKLSDGYYVHVIALKGKLYMSCGDVSCLFWRDEDPDCLYRRLRAKDIAITIFPVTEDEYPELFNQLKRFRVRGIKVCEGIHIASLYPLKNVLDILNIFGHPSTKLREDIEKEILAFKANDELWKTFSELDLEDTEEIVGETDNDKFKKLCIYDLKASLEGLRFKRLKMMSGLVSSKGMTDLTDEIKKIEGQCKRFEKRIKELEELCTSYKSKLVDI